MTKPPRLGIGLPVYNGEQWIESTIESILEQTFEDFELFINDNASTDRTEQICRRYASSDDRIKYERNPKNIGLFPNHDRVFHRADNEFFKWWAVGDVCAPTFVEECVRSLDEHQDAVVAHSKTLLFANDPSEAKEYARNLNLVSEDPVQRFRQYFDQTRLNNSLYGVMRSSALKETALHRPFKSSDISLMSELALRGKLLCVEKPLFFRRHEEGTATALLSDEAMKDFFVNEPGEMELLQRWKLECHIIKGALRAPMPLRDKLRLLRHLGRRLRWGRHKLARELVIYGRVLLKGPRLSRS